jgi:ABC-type nickel/cobalt efflux system permease component RcnA
MTNVLAVIGVGFLLGVRHATDPDHVIAVSTIVSRQRSVRQAGLIGALWGVGHTVTIFLVGAAIILFNLAIPPRIGLAMELAVGLMLILLGILNLTGVTQWITYRLTPAHSHTGVGIVHSHVHEHEGVLHEHIHSHEPEIHTHLDQKTQRPTSKCVAAVRAVSVSAAPCSWTRSRARRIGRRRSTCLDRHSRSSLGDRLSSGFWFGNDRWNDADHDDYWCAICLYRQTVCTLKS